MISSIVMGDWGQAFDYFKAMLLNVADFIQNALLAPFKFIWGAIVQLGEAINNFFGGVFDGLLGRVTDFIKDLVSKIPDFLLPDSIIQWAATANQTIKDNSQSILETTINSGVIPAAASVSPSISGSSVDNSRHSSVDVGGITVIAKSDNPKGIASETKAAMEFAWAANSGVA